MAKNTAETHVLVYLHDDDVCYFYISRHLPLDSVIQDKGEELSPLRFDPSRTGCDTEVVLKEPDRCSRTDWKDGAYSWSIVLDCTLRWDRLTLPEKGTAEWSEISLEGI